MSTLHFRLTNIQNNESLVSFYTGFPSFDVLTMAAEMEMDGEFHHCCFHLHYFYDNSSGRVHVQKGRLLLKL